MVFNYTKDKNNIVTLTMDMAEKSANLIDEDYFKSLLENIVKLENESDLKGVILTSAKKTFLAGADLEMLYSLREAKACYEFVEAGKLIMRRFEQLGKPIVAAINGTALGAGMELALCCHYRIAIDNPIARFGFPEVNLGIPPGAGGTQRLTRFVGKSKAMEMCLTGRFMDAEEAERSGLVSRIVTSSELVDEAVKTADAISKKSLQANMIIKEAVNRAYETTLSEGVRFERRMFHACFGTDHQKEGMAAFVEKRKPEFENS